MISYQRLDEKGKSLFVVCNFAPVRWENYLLGVPKADSYREVFSSEEERFGGSGFTNGEKILCDAQSQGQWQDSITIDIPPLSCMIFAENDTTNNKEESSCQ